MDDEGQGGLAWRGAARERKGKSSPGMRQQAKLYSVRVVADGREGARWGRECMAGWAVADGADGKRQPASPPDTCRVLAQPANRSAAAAARGTLLVGEKKISKKNNPRMAAQDMPG